jgi:hypothetical protein
MSTGVIREVDLGFDFEGGLGGGGGAEGSGGRALEVRVGR